MAISFDGKLTLALQSKDRKAAAKWYQDRLGFTLLYDVEEIGWCELASPVANVNIGLSQVESPKVGGAVPTFGVADIVAARKQLEAQGVRFDGPTHTIPGLVMLATLFDLDGNALMLTQDLSGH
jgi:CreA protein